MTCAFLLVSFLLVVPNVLCDYSDEEFCPNQKTGKSSSRTRYEAEKDSGSPSDWMKRAYDNMQCTVSLCTINGGNEKTTELSCPNPPARPHGGSRCAKIGRYDVVNGRLPYCCLPSLCENVTDEFEEGGENIGPNGENYEYPSKSNYDNYEGDYLKGNQLDSTEHKKCKDLKFKLPESCKLLDEEETYNSEVGCRYQCRMPLLKTVEVTTLTDGADCTFTHNKKEIRQNDRTGKCEKWDCKKEKLYIHTCIRNISTISYPGNCTVINGETPDSPASYPNCCPSLNCTTKFPWEFGSDAELYYRTFQ